MLIYYAIFGPTNYYRYMKLTGCPLYYANTNVMYTTKILFSHIPAQGWKRQPPMTGGPFCAGEAATRGSYRSRCKMAGRQGAIAESPAPRRLPVSEQGGAPDTLPYFSIYYLLTKPRVKFL